MARTGLLNAFYNTEYVKSLHCNYPGEPHTIPYTKKELSEAFRGRSGCLAVSSGQGGKICSRRQRSFRKMSSLGGKPETSRGKCNGDLTNVFVC